MTATTRFQYPSIDEIDHNLRKGSPATAARWLHKLMTELHISYKTSNGYLDGSGYVCAVGSLLVLLAPTIDELNSELIDFDADDGELIADVSIALEDLTQGTSFYAWIADHTRLSYNEVSSLEQGFESYGFNPNQAGLANPPAHEDPRRFYVIGCALRSIAWGGAALAGVRHATADLHEWGY